MKPIPQSKLLIFFLFFILSCKSRGDLILDYYNVGGYVYWEGNL